MRISEFFFLTLLASKSYFQFNSLVKEGWGISQLLSIILVLRPQCSSPLLFIFQSTVMDGNGRWRDNSTEQANPQRLCCNNVRFSFNSLLYPRIQLYPHTRAHDNRRRRLKRADVCLEADFLSHSSRSIGNEVRWHPAIILSVEDRGARETAVGNR